MKLFACDNCQQTLYFENSRCVNCGEAQGYAPELARLVTLRRSPDGAADTFETPLTNYHAADRPPPRYRLCRNAREHDACNWLVPADEDMAFCRSCALSEIIPDLSVASNQSAWRRIEAAKRRLLYTLFALRLPVRSRIEDADRGLAFRFLKGTEDAPVMTGHDNGVITLNVDEADFAFRENMREKMGEGYRTVLGHLRHEIGHYYWGLLVAESNLLADFRKLFGDERANYEEALERHYSRGAPADWGATYVSAYAAMHPWEDFAETWAHYLHLVDTLETASSHGLSLRATATEKPGERVIIEKLAFGDFDALASGWSAVTLALNSLNRSMGMEDAYPFVLTTPVLEKLRFVHRLVHAPVLSRESFAAA
jgi:hypothetical protein